MKVKICGIRNEHDLKAAVEAGADAVGFLVGQVHFSKDFILSSTAARLADKLPPFITPVIVTHYTEPDAVIDIVKQTSVTTIQLHGGCTPDQVKEIRNRLPASAKIIVAANFEDERDFVSVMEFYTLADAILLDSIDKEAGKVGGTGKVGNWEVASKFVKASPVPVILAGGLDGANVSDAIRAVSPFGVDANSLLKDENGDVELVKCREYVRNAHKMR